MQPDHFHARRHGLKGLLTSAGSATLGLFSRKPGRGSPAELELAELGGGAHIKAGAPAALGQEEEEAGGLDAALDAPLPSSADDQARAPGLEQQQQQPAQHPLSSSSGPLGPGHGKQRPGQQLEQLEQEERSTRQLGREDSSAHGSEASTSTALQQVRSGRQAACSPRSRPGRPLPTPPAPRMSCASSRRRRALQARAASSPLPPSGDEQVRWRQAAS
jgi:hypothetical protein